jgi:hypothetical protein
MTSIFHEIKPEVKNPKWVLARQFQFQFWIKNWGENVLYSFNLNEEFGKEFMEFAYELEMQISWPPYHLQKQIRIVETKLI